ncbi:MAG: hypothetical protein OXU20_33880 [Myxococcales bacterium]|nr:hypothetical protein [Myxococcales bacterium]
MEKLNGFDIQAFLRGIDRDPGLAGSRVMFFDGAHLTVLRGGPPQGSAAGQTQSRAAGTAGRYSVGVVKAYATY